MNGEQLELWWTLPISVKPGRIAKKPKSNFAFSRRPTIEQVRNDHQANHRYEQPASVFRRDAD